MLKTRSSLKGTFLFFCQYIRSITAINTTESCLVKKQSPRMTLQIRYLPWTKRNKLSAKRKIRKLISNPISRRMKGKQRAQKTPTGRLSFFKRQNRKNPAREALIKEMK